jgi:hypothetical protein
VLEIRKALLELEFAPAPHFGSFHDPLRELRATCQLR